MLKLKMSPTSVTMAVHGILEPKLLAMGLCLKGRFIRTVYGYVRVSTYRPSGTKITHRRTSVEIVKEVVLT